MSGKAFGGAKLAAILFAALISSFGSIESGKAQGNAPAATPTPVAPGTPAPPAAPPMPATTPATPPAAAGNPPPNAPTAAPMAPTPVAPAPIAPPTAPAPASPPAAAPAEPTSPPAIEPPNDATETQTLELVGRPAAYSEGKATWEEGFSTINGAIASIDSELAKAGLKPAGRPIAVFTETDDTSFRFRAMVPIDAIPAGKTRLTDVIQFGQTPAGKAMKFEHRGSYEDIDSTYEAITAYLDEKGLESQNLFYEEYLNDVKTPDDPTLEVDIYVLLK
jgi:effector-binding domain-containing protein